MLDFLGIGSQRAGTTWLYTHLRRHPQLSFPAGKEIHFWDRREGRGAEAWLELFADAPPGVRQGEITPAYALLERATVEEIRRARPPLRIFYSVRNPMDRAWSAALMALERAELEEREVSDQWFIDHFQSAGSRQRGDYAGVLERWRSVFPADQIQLVFFDDIVSDPRTVLVELAKHLGVDEKFYRQAPESELGQPVHEGPGSPIRSSLRPVLHELYDAAVDRFSERSGRDLAGWKSDL